ncbi:MAG: hypothetical protein ABF601_10535, partial [Lacticaseibacillus paracasei]
LLHPATWIPDFVMFFIAVCILVALIYILKPEPIKLFSVLIMLSLAFITKLILGFSPTIWASGDRTGIFLFYALGVASLAVLGKHNASKPLQGAILSLGAFCYLGWI